MKRMTHWQDPINGVLGIALVASPWIFGFLGDTTATVNAVVVGVALFAAALGAIFIPRAWEEWTEAALGLWTGAAPWLLGFASDRAATGSALVIGLAILVLAVWVLVTDKEYGAWLRDGTVH